MRSFYSNTKQFFSNYALTILLSVFSLGVRSQNKAPGYKDYFMEGSYLLLENEPDKALENFKKAYEFDSTSANINYMLGISYMQSDSQKEKAEYYLSKAVKNISNKYKSDNAGEKAAAPLAHFYYGKALHFNYKFEEALVEFNAFKPYVNPKDKEYVKMLDREVVTNNLAKQMINFPLNVKITNLGDKINSPYPDYSAVLSGDERTLIYTTRRPENTGGMKDSDGSDFEDIVVSYKDNKGEWSPPTPLGINTFGHEASINLSPDGQTLIVYKNELGGKTPAGNGNIYYTEYNGKDWATLLEFGDDVNTPYLESHACLSTDGNVLFFSSERPGGFGGKDIYRCVKLPNGKWSKALNMGPDINTEYDEDGGFIHPDGQTFYFASNGLKSIGGFDILYATLNEENKFSNVTNIGYPINTTDDDLFYVTSPDAKRAYFSSSKGGGYGNKDIYRITLEEVRETYLALFKGQILPAQGETLPENITIVVTDKESNEVIGVYRPKFINGTFTTILPPGKQYNFSYQVNNHEEFYNEDIFVSNEFAYQEIKREVALEPVRMVGKIKVIQNTILLNTLVLDNVKNKKPVSGAKVILEELGGGKQIFASNEKGRTDSIILLPDRKYAITMELNDKKSETAVISTFSTSTARVMSEVIYMEGSPKVEPSQNLQLDLAIKHPKTKKPVAGVNIVLTDANGQKTELVSDANGNLKNVALIPEMKYEVMAYKDNAASEKIIFTTGPADKPKRFSKSIFLDYNAPGSLVGTPVDSSGSGEVIGQRFEFYYTYGVTTINEKEQNWQNFIEYTLKLLAEKPGATLFISGSASKVPMRAAGGNPKLAADRADNFKQFLLKTLQAKGLDPAKIKLSLSSVVGGPEYRGDYLLNRKTYEKFQYVKAVIKK